MFKSDGFDYFTEMMPALHNYITVDTEGFISSEARIAAVFEMCKTMLTQVRCTEVVVCSVACRKGDVWCWYVVKVCVCVCVGGKW